MVDPIPPEVKKVWDKWNIRGTILLSLSLQTFLILFAPYRKSTRQRLLMMLIWSAYLLADAAANFTVGLISNSQGSGSNSSHAENGDLLAFWAPFLLLHLGGPDTITAFALEDNELWLRHLLGLGFQAVAAVYVFTQSIPNQLTVPIILMLVAGIIKYLERTCALYLSSLDKFRDSMLRKPELGPNYEMMEELAFTRENLLPTKMIVLAQSGNEGRIVSDVPVKKGQLNDLEVVYYAHKYFSIFKALVVELVISSRDGYESRDFFRVRSAEDALRVIEVELNFIYEALYTKVQVVHSIGGYIFRAIAFGSVIASLGVFHFKIEKHGFNQLDVGITYTLLWGAVALDIIALCTHILSDRTFASIKDPDTNKTIFARFSKGFLKCKRPVWRRRRCVAKGFERNHDVMATPILFRRWSGSFASYNLISYCLRSRPRRRIHQFTRWPHVFADKITGLLHVECCCVFVYDSTKYAQIAVRCVLSGVISILGSIKKKFIDGTNFVVENPRRIPRLRHIIEKIGVAVIYLHELMTPNNFLDEIIYVAREPFTKELWVLIFDELKNKADYADDPEMAKSISAARGEWVLKDRDCGDCSDLLKYVTDVQYDESLLLWHIATDLCYYTQGEKPGDVGSFDYKGFSKLLSDYMLYLLIMRPTMMSAVGDIAKVRFEDTCAEAKRFFEKRNLKKIREEEACEAILTVKTDFKRVAGLGSTSVFVNASKLAKELNLLEKRGLSKWKLVSRVWVEMISYAAIHCRANAHAQQLSRGGEFITFIWLLMSHLGLGKPFKKYEAATTLIMGK